MNNKEVCHELRALFHRHPAVLVEWLLSNDSPRELFFSELERQNKQIMTESD